MHKLLKKISLSLINIALVKLDNKWNYDNVLSPFSRLYYIKEGSATVFHHGKEFHLKKGYLYLVPSFTYSRYKCDDFMEQYYISFFDELENGLSIYDLKSFHYEVKAKKQDIQNLDRLLGLNPNRELKDGDPKIYDNYLTLMDYEKKNEMLSSSAFLESQGLLLALFSRFIMDKDVIPQTENINSQKIAENLRYILLHLDNELSVKELAQKMHLHPDHYSRVFKIHVGMNPIEFIQLKRIERAQLLLMTTSDTMHEISHKIGIQNLSYFSKLFKRITGSSPGRFRRKAWENITA